jgi:hypothetical protein
MVLMMYTWMIAIEMSCTDRRLSKKCIFKHHSTGDYTKVGSATASYNLGVRGHYLREEQSLTVWRAVNNHEEEGYRPFTKIGLVF